jgi:hypothetical protein
MKLFFPLLITSLLVSICTRAQDECIDGFIKLFPDPTVDYSLNFGSSVSIHDNFLAVGVPNSDTLSRESGIVYIYEKRAGNWVRISSMVASHPVPDLQLGISVKLTENYLFASASAGGGSVYVYRKPSSGWATSTQTSIISLEGTRSFGTAYHHPVDLSEDENTLVITDARKPHNTNPTTIAGSIFVFHKSTDEEWSSSLSPVEIKATTNVIDLGRNGTYIRGNRIFAGTPFSNSGRGNIFIYHDPGGTFANPVLDATLSPVDGGTIWVDNMVVTDEGIFIAGTTASAGIKIFFYPKPAENNWTDTSPVCLIDPDGDGQTLHFGFIRLGATSTSLFAIFQGPNGIYLAKLTQGHTGWCTPAIEIVETRSSQLFPKHGTLLSVNENEDIVTGFVDHPWNSLSTTALHIYASQDGGGWTSSTLYSTATGTRGHGYGHALAVLGDLMFVSAPLDNSVKERGGKVYVYKKDETGSEWTKISVINTPVGTLQDSQFGSALATNGQYLAVGARGWQPSRILIYSKGANDWAQPALKQVIRVPAGGIEDVTYGESVVMDERWMLIPIVNDRGFTTMKVAVYELVGARWTYRQTLETNYTGIFTGTPNGGAAISGNTLVAGSEVFELDEGGVWQRTCTLSPSDPESLSFSYPRFEMVSNGSNFGRTVAIRENTIVIGAPRQDSFVNGHVWDVGAVYVFTKAPHERWTNKTETIKIVPDETVASSLFGWVVAFVDQALIIGAPNASTFAKPDPNQSPKNNAPGKVYVYQADDPSWKKVTMAQTYAGQTGFRDNFGVQVAYEDGQIFIGASEEDISTGRTSGSVYITDAPPIIRYVAPLCIESAPVTLSSTMRGGTWSGPGITNPITGEFSPHVAGAGIHELTYVGGACSRLAKINISVSAVVRAQLRGPNEVFICATPISFTHTLSVAPVAGASYQWFFRPPGEVNFVMIPNKSSRQITVSQRGEYQARLFNAGCEDFSKVVTIRDESVEILIDPPGEVCGTPPGGMELSATPAGGVWSGQGITQNKFSIDGVADGNYVLNYQYTSGIGCTYEKQTTVTVKRLPTPVIQREGNLCESGVVALTLSGVLPEGAESSWNQRMEDGTYVVVGDDIRYEVTTWGSFQLITRKGDCQSASVPYPVLDTFSAVLTPPEEKTELCHDHDLRLFYPPDALSSFEWYYSPDGQPTTRLDEESNSMRPDKTGYYAGIVRRGICSVTGPTKYIYVHQKDSVFVPNVFTPNGDGKNDSFFIMVLNQDDDPADGDVQDNVSYEIYNRYGRSIFTAPKNQPWSGSNAEGGVYFWYGKYHTCQGDVRTIKGIVHLIK